MSELASITLPWPDTKLSPNTRQHWAALARAKKVHRQACFVAAKSQGIPSLEANPVSVLLEFYPPSRRKIDEDNCVSRMKAGLDGLADALGIDDSLFRLERPVLRESEGKPGFVQVTLKEIAQGGAE